MTRVKAELLLAAIIVARGSSYLFSKLSLGTIGPFTMLALRFIISFALLYIIFFKKINNINRKEMLHGSVLGILLFTIVALELYGLKTIDSSMASFIENIAIVLIPIFEAILIRKLPKPAVMISTFIILLGVGFLTMENSTITLSVGEMFCIGSAALYAVMVIFTDRVCHEGDPITLGVVQIGVVGILGLCTSFIFEQPHLPASGQEWFYIMSLAVICTVFGFTFQPLAQKYISANRSGQICALNPVTAAVLGWVFLNEQMGLLKIFGAILIVGGVLYTGSIQDNNEELEETPNVESNNLDVNNLDINQYT